MVRQRLFLIAGEPSGDQLGGALMRSLRELAPGRFQLIGIGGHAMMAEGLKRLFPMRDLAVMGFTEIIPHLPRLMNRVARTVTAIEKFQPAAVVTIDSPGFVNRVIARLRKRGRCAPIFIHYVAPTVWAYKPQRAERAARLYDFLLTLLPFEPPYFEEAGLPTRFVGHPIVDDLDRCFHAREAAGTRPPERLRLCLLAGSRRGEIARLLPVYCEVVDRLAKEYPDLGITLPMPEDLVDEVAAQTAGWPVRPMVVSGVKAKIAAFRSHDIALAKSGTVTLEVAKCGLPMVMAYRVHPLSAYVARRMMLTKYFCLINILLQREVIPEKMQEHCRPDEIFSALRALIEEPQRAEKQKAESYAALAMMRAPGGRLASELAAEAILELLPSSS